MFFSARHLRRREGEMLMREPNWLREIEAPTTLAHLERPSASSLPERTENPARQQVEELADARARARRAADQDVDARLLTAAPSRPGSPLKLTPAWPTTRSPPAKDLDHHAQRFHHAARRLLARRGGVRAADHPRPGDHPLHRASRRRVADALGQGRHQPARQDRPGLRPRVATGPQGRLAAPARSSWSRAATTWPASSSATSRRS